MHRRTFILGSFLAAARKAGHLTTRYVGCPQFVQQGALAFGTTVSIAVAHEDAAVARAAIDEALGEVRRIDRLMTVFRPDSQVGRLNAEGALRNPDPRLVQVLEFSQRLAALSDGAFDVTVQPLWLLFTRCKAEGRIPSRAEISQARSLVGWTHLEVSPRAIRFARRGMSISLNGVAQGYATDLAVAALRSRGIRDALVDTGELGAEGSREPGRAWRVGIQHPRDPAAILASVEMDGRFLATSGDYATAFTPDFVHHHIFDPRAGVSPRALSSVAVAAASGMEADGLTKPMMVLEPARAHRLLSRFPGAGAVFVDKRGGIVASRGLRLALSNLEPPP
ncbi:MAG: FAD:protein FMN transferase [Deltaproteobacteria bacterium]